MHKRLWVISVTLCAVLTVTGCGSKKEVNYNAGQEDSVEGAVNAASESDSEESDDVDRGLLARQLGIPESAKEDIPVDGTSLTKIVIDDPDVEVPDKDKMYTKDYFMDPMTADGRKALVESVLDENSGIYNYPEEYFDSKDMDRETVEKIFEDNDVEPDYSGDYFVGKIDGEPYVVRFMFGDDYIDEGFAVSRACQEEVPEELAARQVTHVSYMEDDPADYADFLDLDVPDEEDQEDSRTDKEEDNHSGMTMEQAEKKAAEYMQSLGYLDIIQTSITDMYRLYESDDFNIVQYDKDGYMVRFDASMNGVPLYQPVTTQIDTITHMSSTPGGNVPRSNYYCAERSYFELRFNEDGIIELYGYSPMLSDDELHEADSLITWDQAVESLKKAVPEHFAGYTGYTEVTFNDVRLTYFRTKTGDNEYEIVPVYVFSYSESYDTNAPIQLIIIDARDGSEINIIQDPGRMGIV